MAETFQYRARDAQGAERQGVLSGDSANEVARTLVGMGLVPVDIRAKVAELTRPKASTAGAAGAAAAVATPGAAPLKRLWRQRLGKRVQEAMGLVMRELSALLRAGVPLMRALQLAADSASEDMVRDALRRVARDLDNGHNLVMATEREYRTTGLFTAYDVAMLQVGEQTGRLSEAFADLHRHREFQRSTQEQVAAALRYPAFVILTCVAALVVVNLWVIPSFARVFAQARTELPMLTQLLLGLSNTMLAYWPYLAAATVAGVFGWRHALSRPAGRLWWDRVKLRLPVVGPILVGILQARLSGSLASSISAGLTISDSLNVTSRTLGNRHYEARLQQMCSDLARGVSITAAARNMGVLPPTMLQLFAIGEEAGAVDELMREISVHYQSEVDYAVKRLSATLEPILIWFLGMGVLVLALGIFMPMWDLGRATMR